LLFQKNKTYDFKYLNSKYNNFTLDFGKIFDNIASEILTYKPNIFLTTQSFIYNIIKYSKNNLDDITEPALEFIRNLKNINVNSIIICRYDPARLLQNNKFVNFIKEYTFQFDNIATHTLQMKHIYRKNNVKNIYWFPNYASINGFYPDKISNSDYKYDISFVGHIDKEHKLLLSLIKNIRQSFLQLICEFVQHPAIPMSNYIYLHLFIIIFYNSIIYCRYIFNH